MPEEQEGNQNSAIGSTTESAGTGRPARLNNGQSDVVEVTFYPSGITGLVATGTYVSDAARRLGVKLIDKCVPAEGKHFCAFKVMSETALSPITADEKAFFSGSVKDEAAILRLGCRTRLVKPGEIEITMPANEENPKRSVSNAGTDNPGQTSKDSTDDYLQRFAALPLEQKISELVKLEAIALSDTLTYVMNAPFTIADRILGGLAELGLKKEREMAESLRPDEHRTEADRHGEKEK